MSNLRTPILKSSIALVAFLTIIYGAVLLLDSKSKSTDICDLTVNQCELSVAQQRIEVRFEQPPQIEQQLRLHISATGPVNVQGASISGVNMYMGKIAVVEESVTAQKWSGWTMLGACSEPNMIWQLTLQIDAGQGIETRRLRFETSI